MAPGMNDEVLRQIPLFQSLSKDARRFILHRLKAESFTAGDIIVRQGETGDSLYVITTGLVKVTNRQKNGVPRELARLKVGDYFGEMSLLGGQPRSADITAIMDTTTLVLYKDDLDQILEEYPTIAVHFSKVLSKRLRDTSSFLYVPAKPKMAIVALYSHHADPLFQSVLAINLAASFTKELLKRVLLLDISNNKGDLSRMLHLGSKRITMQDEPASRNILAGDDFLPYLIEHRTGFHFLPIMPGLNSPQRAGDADIRLLLDKLKKAYDYILINCPPERVPLVQTAFEQSDNLIYLAPTTDEAIQRCRKDTELFLKEQPELGVTIGSIATAQPPSISRRVLEETFSPHPVLMIHPETTLFDRFVRTGRPFVYDHPQSRFSRSIQRISRKIGRVRVGLALGSGAARGFAHVGLLKVIEAHDLPLDMIAGSSMGSFVGGFFAAGVTASELEEMVLNYQDKRKVQRTIFDVTIPRYGLFKGNRLAKFMRQSLGDVTFEDLQIPFIAVATDISDGSEVILRDGIVWQALRASGSVPVMFEPYSLNGRYLIDGGITNPLPTDILIEHDLDIIISCTVNSVQAPKKSPADEAALSLSLTHRAEQKKPRSSKKNMYGILDALTRSLGIMSAANTIQKARLADIDIRPDVSHIDWRDFHRGDELIAEGVNAGEKAIPAILELIHGNG
ncbi:cyclic nucleotide-binding domain-containing protein [candidate division KSB3 bacterium]|uniref:Cyclic nucleotide-binding domain-containing protein n=1 Tax=candidate division KSB3 bacterium TaxID=2044937 RepID=A0A9D5JYD2_9BACT|nr:cyclic nucleotide-binding domain-containing protein [candidate division KSB3 bacterium]MBD3326589.1 cyclic nucleotide-binding domain-containing protein [candidate division KSB3 bacterium]